MQWALYPPPKEEEALFFASHKRIRREALWPTHDLSMTQGRVGIQAIVPVSITSFSNFKYNGAKKKMGLQRRRSYGKKTQQHNNPGLLLFWTCFFPLSLGRKKGCQAQICFEKAFIIN